MSAKPPTKPPDRRKKNPDAPVPYSVEFERWWKHYPRKAKKYDAWLRFKKVLPTTKLSLLIMRARQFAQSDACDHGQRFVPHATTWLNQRYFEDDPSSWSWGLSDGNGKPDKNEIDWNFKQ